MTILLTGASGFVGSAIVKHSRHNVIALSRRRPDVLPKNCQYIKTDLVVPGHVDAVIDALENVHIDAVVHCAAVVPWASVVNYDDDIVMAHNVVRMCKALHCKNLLYMSGWNVYAVDENIPYTETASLAPETPYGKSKLAVENYLNNNLQTTAVVSLRLASVYGPGQTSPGLITNLTSQLLQKQPLMIQAVRTKRDYLYINDLVGAVDAIVPMTFYSNDAINLGGGSVSVLRIAKTISVIGEQELGIPTVLQKDKQLKEAYPINNELSITKARQMGLLHKRTTIEKGLRATIMAVKVAQ